LDLGQTTYAGCNNQHFTELLAERESIALSLLHAPNSPRGWNKESQKEIPQSAAKLPGVFMHATAMDTIPRQHFLIETGNNITLMIMLLRSCHDWA
jgi:hypothetical protein